MCLTNTVYEYILNSPSFSHVHNVKSHFPMEFHIQKCQVDKNEGNKIGLRFFSDPLSMSVDHHIW